MFEMFKKLNKEYLPKTEQLTINLQLNKTDVYIIAGNIEELFYKYQVVRYERIRQ